MQRITKVIVVGLWLLLSAQSVYAAAIVLDGQFNDWAGQPYIGDSQGDTPYWWYADLRNWYWTTDGTNAYFMAERWPPSSPKWDVYYFLQFDLNNNGQYSDVNDRWMLVHYKPKKKQSEVTVDLYNGQGSYLSTLATKKNWGDSEKSGGTRVEWMVSFADLGITGTTAINMVISTADVVWQGNTGWVYLLDPSAEVQWTPVDALGWPLLILTALGGGWLIWRRRM